MSDFNDDDTRLSRSGVSSISGKLTRRLDIPVSEEIEEAVIALAAVARVPKAEYVRMLIERNVFGDLMLMQRMARQAGLGPSYESPTDRRAA